MPSNALGMGVGAGAGLQQLLTQLMAEDQIRRQKDQFAQTQGETVRSHMADEDYKNRALQSTVADREANQSALAADRQGRLEETTRANARQEDVNRPIGTTVPFTKIPAGSDQTMWDKTPGPKVSKISGFKLSTPGESVAPDQAVVKTPEPPSALDAPDMATFKGTQNNILNAGKADDARDKANTAAEAKVKELEIRAGAAQTAAERASVQNELSRAQADLARYKQKTTSSLSSASKTQAQNASNVMSHLDDIDHEVENIDKMGLLGPVGGRWADFLAGKIGSADIAASPDQQEALDEFRTDIGLLKSGMAMVHGGARGGGSIAMVQRMDALINAAQMNKPLLQGSLNSFRKWLKTYAEQGGADTGAPSGGSGGGDAYQEYLNRTKAK